MLFNEKITPRKIRVMLVDDSAILLCEAIPFLVTNPQVEVVGSVYQIARAVAQAQMLTPDVVLLDVTIRGLQALSVIPQLLRVNPALSVIVLDEMDGDHVKHAALAQGAAAFIAKQSVKTDLLPAILARAESHLLDA